MSNLKFCESCQEGYLVEKGHSCGELPGFEVMENSLEKFRKWQRQNPDWELVCDFDGDINSLWVGWPDITKSERMHWIGKYGAEARSAFEEFGTPRPKVEIKTLGEDLRLYPMTEWPADMKAMSVYRTKIDGVSII